MEISVYKKRELKHLSRFYDSLKDEKLKEIVVNNVAHNIDLYIDYLTIRHETNTETERELIDLLKGVRIELLVYLRNDKG